MNQFFGKPQVQGFKITLLLWFIFLGQIGFGQNLTQTIRGSVADEYTHNPLEGATVFITNLNQGESTDISGNFRLEEIPVGRHQLQISYLGYETLIISEVLLESGKELVLEIELTPSSANLNEVVVKGLTPSRRDKASLGAEIFTIEETLRMPATFNDPARLAFSYAGVNATNDQANHLVIRGNSPNNMSWRLEGVEIVNPNHTNNAGTASDRPTQNGGGVNILSAQLLGNSTFMRAAFPSAFGNVLAGVMDMNFRKGNNETYEFTGRIGVIGIDVAAEGPLSKKSKASFLVNYRYSTLGLLGAAGVDLGDEFINYQDLAFHLNFPMKRGGSLSFFAFGGNSVNEFEAKEVEDWAIEKDQFDIDFKSKMGAGGLKIFQPINEKVTWNLSAVFSATESERVAGRNILLDSVSTIFVPQDDDNILQQKFSFNTSFDYRLKENNRLRFGVVNTLLNDERNLFSKTLNQQLEGGTLTGTLLQPYFDWEYDWTSLVMNVGVRSVFFTFNNTSSFEPRASLKYKFLGNNSLGLAYNLQSQRQLPQIYFTPGKGEQNQELELTKSHQVSLVYERMVNKKTQLRLTTYYQSLFDVPIALGESNSFSALNVFADAVNLPLENEGTGKNYGVEISAQQYFYNNTFWLGNVSLYESKYKGSDGIERDTRFNGNYIVNATYGKEFPYSKKGKDYILGVNAHVNFAGGLRETPIDEIASEDAGTTVFVESEAFSLRQKNVFRTDLRVYWKRNKKRFNSTLALDVQNVTNTKNESFRYYDTFLQKVEQKYQLGLIPILSYRIEW